MLKASEKSLVLLVFNAQQLHINDEKEFFSFVCDCMKEGGKQSRDRYLFVVNKMNTFNPDDGDSVKGALDSVISELDENDIKNANIFPVGALATLEIREHSKRPNNARMFSDLCSDYGDMFYFEDYYKYNHLPLSSRSRIEALKHTNDPMTSLEVHTGIPSVEEAIRLYVNKYARTMKVKDLVDAFNHRLTELKAVAEIQDSIRKNKDEKARIDKKINEINAQISTGQSAKEYAVKIDNINVKDKVKEEVDKKIGGLSSRIDNEISGFTNATKWPKRKAMNAVEQIIKERKDMQAQFQASINSIMETSFKNTYDQIIAIYKAKLNDLGFSFGNNDLTLNPLNLVSEEIGDIGKLVNSSTRVVDEGHKEKYQVQKTRRGSKKTNWFWEPWNWGTERYNYETYTEEKERWIPKKVEYVDMQKVVNDYFVPLQEELTKIEKSIPEHVDKETQRLKSELKGQLKSVDQVLSKKLKELSASTNQANQKQEAIRKQESDLKWMNGIITRVNKLINY